MRRFSRILEGLCIGSLFVFIVTGCGDGALPPEKPIAILTQPGWKDQITVKDFESKYTENRKIEEAKADSLPAYQDFLTRYIDFKLKVKDAYDKGLDKDPAVTEDFSRYREMVAKPYLMEKEVFEKVLREMYERTRTEIEASHILVRLSEGASSEDSLRASTKINQAYQRALKGENFDSLAIEYSEEPGASQSKGRLPVYSAGMMVYQFEDKSYETAKGGISAPFLTRFGYHIIKVWDKRPRTPDIRISHIMILARQGSSPSDTLTAYYKAVAIREAIEKGGSFEVFARDSSDDRNSAIRETPGDLGIVSRGTFARFPSFEEAAFSLKTPGDISEIVKTSFGYHIIKLGERRGTVPFEMMEEELRTQLKNNTEKMDAELDKLIARWKPELKYVETLSTLNRIVEVAASIDTAKRGMLPDQFRFDETDNQRVAYRFADRVVTLAEVISRMKRGYNEPKVYSFGTVLREVRAMSREDIIDYEVNRLEKRYREFATLMQSYSDANLLFANLERTVLSKAQPNDSLAKVYYDLHAQEFRFEDRILLHQIAVTDSSKARALYNEVVNKTRTLDLKTPKMVEDEKKKLQADMKKLRAQKPKSKADKASLAAQLKAKEDELKSLVPDTAPRSFERLAELYGEELESIDVPIFNIPLTSGPIGLFQRGENPTVTEIFDEPVGYTSPIKRYSTGYVMLKIDGKEPARVKTFDEAKAEAAARFQEAESARLENEWVDGLRKKTTIVIDEKALNRVFGRKP